MVEIHSKSTASGLTTAVIVLARDETDRIDRCLEAILDQSHPPGRVIVVDHGSRDNTAARVRANKDERILLVSIDAQIGIAAARNTGIAATNADLIFFIDGDCVPHRHWLAEGLAALSDQSLAGVEGITYYEAPTPVTISDTNTHQFCAGGYMTCNIAYRRVALVAADNFDPRFRYGHEDRELAFRIRRSGENRLQPGDGRRPPAQAPYGARDVAPGPPRPGSGALFQTAWPPGALLRQDPLPGPAVDTSISPDSVDKGEHPLTARPLDHGRLLSIYLT